MPDGAAISGVSEVGGHLIDYVDPLDDGQIIAAIEKLVFDEKHYQLRLTALQKASLRTWDTFSKELATAMARHDKDEVRVIPVMLRSCEWSDMPYAKLQALPTGAVPVNKFTSAVCEYGVKISAAMRKENFYGLQFHPEKSAAVGIDILNTFLDL